MKKQVNITIHGHVQGVGFRFWLKQIALELELSGFIRNRDDKTVYTVVQGNSDHIDKYIEKCNEGPELAEVLKVEVIEGAIKEEYDDFEMMY